MSSVSEGWYVDPSTGTNLRWWSGTTWTDEVAPLPYEATNSGPVDLFAAVAANVGATGSAEQTGATEAGAEATEPQAQAIDRPAETTGPPVDGRPISELDPEVELTLLTRRELRARRGAEMIPDDAPKHLPPVTSVAVLSAEHWQEPPEQLEIPALPVDEPVGASDDHPGRHRRIVRMSVLLGILAVVSSVAVLTAATL